MNESLLTQFGNSLTRVEKALENLKMGKEYFSLMMKIVKMKEILFSLLKLSQYLKWLC